MLPSRVRSPGQQRPGASAECTKRLEDTTTIIERPGFLIFFTRACPITNDGRRRQPHWRRVVTAWLDIRGARRIQADECVLEVLASLNIRFLIFAVCGLIRLPWSVQLTLLLPTLAQIPLDNLDGVHYVGGEKIARGWSLWVTPTSIHEELRRTQNAFVGTPFARRISCVQSQSLPAWQIPNQCILHGRSTQANRAEGVLIAKMEAPKSQVAGSNQSRKMGHAASCFKHLQCPSGPKMQLKLLIV